MIARQICKLIGQVVRRHSFVAADSRATLIAVDSY